MLWSNTNDPAYLPPPRVIRLDGARFLGFTESDAPLVLSRLLQHPRLIEDARLQAFIADREKVRADAFASMWSNEKASSATNAKALQSAIPFVILGGVAVVAGAFVGGWIVGQSK